MWLRLLVIWVLDDWTVAGASKGPSLVWSSPVQSSVLCLSAACLNPSPLVVDVP